MTPDPAELAGWAPIRAYWNGLQPMLDWCYLGDVRFELPFFDQAIHEVLQRPFSLLFRHQISLDELATWAGHNPVPEPAGFIFHMSRCGSTLVSQMFAAASENIVISEAGPVDFALRAQPTGGAVTEERRLGWLRGVVAAFGRRRASRERNCFIKFDAWHILALPLIRRAFPEVPWIFLYRDPVEVLVSHRREPGGQTVPGVLDPRLFDLDPAALATMPLDEYGARVIKSILEAALAHAADQRSRLLNYTELPGAVIPGLLEFFRVDYAEDSLARMRAAAGRNAKAPAFSFEADSAQKQLDADARIRELAQQWIQPAYEKLEALRLSRHAR